MKVKIKKLHQEAIIPKYSKIGDAGMDLTAVHKYYDEFGNVVYETGLAFEIPEGYVGLLFPRSSNSKKDLLLSNSIGVIDSGYRGEVIFKFKPSAYIMTDEEIPDGKVGNVQTGLTNKQFIGHSKDYYEVRDRVGQIIILPYPKVEFEEVEELSDTERGSGGFGSTGS